MLQNIWFWVFNAVVVVLLALDLFVFHRKAHVVSFKEAAGWSAFWVSLSLGFCGLVWYHLGHDKGVEFLTGYMIEYALSMDNIFVFVLIFSYFKVPPQLQHRVLFWGIIGALVMRAIMIFLGVAIVTRFHWTIYILGAFLVVTGIKLMLPGGDDVNLDNNVVLRLFRRWFRISPNYDGAHFLTRVHGKLMLTPLALVLVVVETTDLVFAVDSIPAILGITRDSFIVYTSNICAILGLRSMYFMLARGVDHFAYLKYGLAAILSFVGVKMLLTDLFPIPIVVSLSVVFSLLLLSVAVSLLFGPKKA
ncbi:MAG TPA: TerC family protein [Chthoniobacteraceae bacterium]|nr:TerC family protein [Chthoniobacteraceae bacterium]